MRWNKLSLIVGLAGVLMSMRTFAVPENSLLASAQPVTHLTSSDDYFWDNQQSLVAATADGVFQIVRRTHRRTLRQPRNAPFNIAHAHAIPRERPAWLPPSAKIVGFDRTVDIHPEAVQEAWIVAWPVSGSAAPTEHPGSDRMHDTEARYGVWITGDDGTKPRLLGVAPLSRQEFEALGRNSNNVFLPDPKKVSFVYRGVLYVMPVFGKPAAA